MPFYVEAKTGNSGWIPARIRNGRVVFGDDGLLQEFGTWDSADHFIRHADLGGAPAPEQTRIVQR